MDTSQFDRTAAVFAALIIVGLVVYLLVRGDEIAGPRLFFALRTVLSLSTAIFGATIPGFLNLSWKGTGLVVRAGGALGLFVLTYAYTPDLGGSTVISAPKGVATQHINGSSINIDNQSSPPNR